MEKLNVFVDFFFVFVCFCFYINIWCWVLIMSNSLLNYRFFVLLYAFEISGDPCNLIGSQRSDLFTNYTIFTLNHLSCSKSRHSCSKSCHFCFKSHHFALYRCSILHHFCFGYKKRCKSLFVSAFQQTGYLVKYSIGND